MSDSDNKELVALRVRVDQLESIVESLITNQISHLAHISLIKDALLEEQTLPWNYDMEHELLVQEIHLKMTSEGDEDDE